MSPQPPSTQARTVISTATAATTRDTLPAILWGEFLPVEAQMCEQLSASRFNFRVARLSVVSEGLVESERNQATHEAVKITNVRIKSIRDRDREAAMREHAACLIRTFATLAGVFR